MNLFVATLFFVVFGILSRLINDKAASRLTPEEQLMLLGGFRSFRQVRYFATGIIILIVVGGAVFWGKSFLYLPLCFLLVLGYTMFGHLYVNQVLKKLDLPETYRKQYSRSRLISYVGYLLFIVTLAWPLLRKEIEQDTCLDAGYRWSDQHERCERQ